MQNIEPTLIEGNLEVRASDDPSTYGDGSLEVGSLIYCDNIIERTVNEGVTIDGVLIKDNDVTVETLTSTVTTGTAPLVVASTTKVDNLNADFLDGMTAPTSSIVGISDNQTLTNKTLDDPLVQNNLRLTSSYIELNGITEPSTPGSNTGRIYMRNDSDELFFKDDNGNELSLVAGASGGEANTITNLGSGVGVFKDKVGTVLRLKSINTANSKLSVTDDIINDEVDININESNISINDFNGAPTGSVLGSTDTQTVINKTLTDDLTLFQNISNNTRKMKFDLSNISNATTRTLTVPNADTTLVGTNTTDTLSNKTLTSPNVTGNMTLSSSYIQVADIAEPANALDGQGRLYKKTSDDGLYWKPDSAGGEVDLTAAVTSVTASNVGTAGVGVFKQKTGNNLEFKNVNVGSNKLTVTDDTGNNEIDLDLVEANIVIGNLSGAPSGAVVGTTDTQTLTNKSLVDSTTSFIDNSDNTKALQFELSGIDTATTRTLTVPNADTTLVGNNTTDTFTNKTIDSDTNTITNIDNNEIKALAGIDATKIADGSVSNSEFEFLNGITSAIVTVDSTQTLTNKTFTDSSTFFQDDSDNTKKLQFELSGITGSTTRTLTVPNANTTIVGTDAAQTLTNKTIDSDNNTITNIENSDIKAAAAIDASKIADGSVSNTEFQRLNAIGSAAVGVSDTQTLSNKTFVDDLTFFEDEADNTKIMQFELDGITTGTTRILSVPDADTTLVGNDATQTLTNKTINADSNTITNIDNDEIKAAAGIDTTKLADGSVSNTEFQQLNGVTSAVVGVSDTQTLSNKSLVDNSTSFIDNSDNTKALQFELSGIDTATTRTLTVPNANTTLVGNNTTDTLTNKTINSDNNTITNIDNNEIKALAGIDATKIADGSVSNTEFEQLNGVTSAIVTVDSTQTLTNKSLVDASTSFIDNSDNTKVMQFELSGLTTATTRTLTVPNADTTIVGTDTTQTLTNKTIDADNNTITNIDNDEIKAAAGIDATKIADGSVSNTEFEFLNGVTSTIVTVDSTQTLTNKSLVDNSTSFIDNSDNTKVMQFELSGIDTATTRTLTVPNANTTLVGSDVSQTLTNKTIDADSNTITNIDNNEIKAAAGIDATKIANGTISNTEFQQLNGITSAVVGISDTQTLTNKSLVDATTSFIDNTDNTKALRLELSGITTATTRTLAVPDANTTIVGNDVSQTLTNKTINADNNTITNIDNNEIKALAGIDATKIADGSVSNTEFELLNGVTSAIVTVDSTQTLSNKSLVDNSTSFIDNSDNTKVMQFELSGIDTATTRTLTVPNANTTLVGSDVSQTLTNKTIDADNNTITNIDDNEIKAAAGINATKIANGTISNTEFEFLNGIGSAVVGVSDTQTLSNKSFEDSSTSFIDDSDNTKAMQFELSGITTATTRTLTVPDANTTIVGTDTTQTLTNKSLVTPNVSNNIITTSSFIELDEISTPSAPGSSKGRLYKKTGDDGLFWYPNGGSEVDITSSVTAEANTASNQGAGGVGLFISKVGVDLQFKNINVGSNKLSVTNDGANKEVDLDVIEGNIVIGNLSGAPSGSVVGTTDTQTLSNKSLVDSTTSFIDNVDNTKALQFELGNLSTATTRTLTVPNANTTIVGTDTTQTLTNKTIDADNNTITNIDNNEIKAAAGIDATKIANGSVSNTEFEFLNGVSSAVVGISDSQTLTNKTIDADSNTITNIENADIKAAAAIDATKIANGTISNTEFEFLNGVTSAVVGISDTQTLTNKTLTDSSTFFQDESDNTKKVQLQLSSLTTSTTRTLTVPDESGIIATQSYVDSVVQNLDYKQSVRVATTGNITLSGTQTIDGVSVVASDRVLVKDQGGTASNSANGIYDVAAGAWSRSSDADTGAELSAGAFTFVEEGTANAGSGYVQITTGTITLGVTALEFAKFSSTSDLTAGDGIDISSNTISVDLSANSGLEFATAKLQVNAGTGLTLTGGALNRDTIDLTADVTGTLPVANGGTGATTLTSGNFLVGAGTSAVTTTKAAPTGDVVGTTDTQTLTNKSLVDASTSFIDNSDNTKALQFELSGLTTATTRTLTVPNANTTIVGTDTIQTLTNKTIDADNNTITNIDNNEIKAAAGIDATKIANGTISNTEFEFLNGVSSTVVGVSDTQTLSNKSLVDASTSFIDDSDNTKAMQFELSGLTTSTTRTLTVPDANTTIVGTDITQTLTNKTIDADSNTITNIDNNEIKAAAGIDATKIANGTISNTEFEQLNGITSTVVGINDTQILTNKSLVDNTTSFIDDSDNTKVMQFELSGISTGTTRTLTVPDANTTIVGTVVTQTLTNKTINSDNNTITNIDNNEIKALAGIDATKIADGSVSNTEFQQLNGVTSAIVTVDGTQTLTNKSLVDSSTSFIDNSDNTKVMQFELSGIDTATTRTLTVPNANTTIVGTDTTVTLTNKTIDADSNTITNIDNNEIKAAAGIDATKIANGSVSNTEFEFLNGVTSTIVGISDTQTLSNKSLVDATTSFIDNADNTKALRLELSGLTTASTRTLTVPDANTTIVGTDTTQTLTNKSIDADNNTITNIDNNEIKALAGIDATKIADGSVSNTEFQQLNGVTGGIVTLNGTQTLTNKSLVDNSTSFIDDSDNTKVMKLELSGITTATTRTLTVPDSNTTIVGTDTTDTLTNKTIDADSNTITNIDNNEIKAAAGIDATKIANGTISNTEFEFLNGVTSSIVSVNDTQTLTNKSLVDSTTSFIDNADNTKILQFQLSGLSTATTRTLTIPDANTTIVGTDTSQTLTNKTIDADLNTITNIDNNEIKAAAGIDATKIANGSISNTEFEFLNGVSSAVVGINDTQTLTNKSLVDASTSFIDNADNTKVLQFQLNNITTATTRTLTVPDANTTIVGTDTTQTLTNKTINADNNTITNIDNNEIKAAAGIDATKIANGTISNTEFEFLNGVGSAVVGISDTQTLTNKTFTDNSTFIQDDVDNTKKVQFQASTVTTGTTRTMTFPNADVVLVGDTNTQLLTNKVYQTPIVITNMLMFGSYLQFADITPPTNPANAQGRLYKKTGNDGLFWLPDAAGAEVDLTTAGSGESNTASNQGAGGVGVFKQKTGVDLEFKNINAGSNKISITDDLANDEIDIDVVESNIPILNLSGAPSGSVVGTTDTQTLTNKTFTDNSTTFQDNVDNTKKAQFQLSGITTATTRTFTLPDSNTTLVGTDTTQVLFNKTFEDNTTYFRDDADTSKRFRFLLGNFTTGVTRMIRPPDADTTLIGTTETATVTNKTISSSTNTVGANELRTTGSSVVIDTSSPPSSNDVLVASSATAAAWGIPLSTNLEAYTIKDDTLSSTTIATYTQKIKLTFTPSSVGDFIVFWFVEYNFTSTGGGSRDAQIKVELDDTTILAELILNPRTNPSDAAAFSGFDILTSLSASSHDIDIDFRPRIGGDTVRLRKTRLSVIRIS